MWPRSVIYESVKLYRIGPKSSSYGRRVVIESSNPSTRFKMETSYDYFVVKIIV